MVDEITVAFVILHYMDKEVTELAVDHIKKINNKKNFEKKVIIVDNNSPNQSGNYLKEYYSSDKDIHVLINNKNEGFARGNNIGYLYAKKILGANVIVVMNNDILIETDTFFEEIDKEMHSIELPDIIAPSIISRDGYYQNPFRERGLSKLKLLKLYLYNLITYIGLTLPVIDIIYKELHIQLKKSKKFKREKKTTIITKRESSDIVPHGSCIIYLKNWISKEDIAFLPNTFMYFEEDILHKYCKKKGYHIRMNSNIEFTHLEDVSTDIVYENMWDKKRFISSNMIRSIKEYMRI